MSNIKDKIMAFVGTDALKAVIDELSEYTDNIYAVVADEYGKVSYPGGNITVISKYLDEDGILRWINNSDIKILIDGTAVYAAEESKIIRNAAEKAGVEYFRIVDRVEMNQRIHISRSAEDVLRRIEYAHGKVLVKGDKQLLHELTSWEKYRDKVCPLVKADGVLIKELLDAGYSSENIICHGKTLSVNFLISLMEEYDITQFIMMGYDSIGMQERLQAADIARKDVIICGELLQEKGYSPYAMWELLARRYKL